MDAAPINSSSHLSPISSFATWLWRTSVVTDSIMFKDESLYIQIQYIQPLARQVDILQYIQGVHEILCFFLKMWWFFWTLPSVLLQSWCLTWHCVRVHTLTHRGETEKGQSQEYNLKSLKKKNTIFNEHPVQYFYLNIYYSQSIKCDPRRYRQTKYFNGRSYRQK